MRKHNIDLGDIVKLKEPYQPSDLRTGKPIGQFTHGIVVEITSDVHISLHLFDGTGKLYFSEGFLEKGVMIPTYVDFHYSELTLYKNAAATGYIPQS